MFSSPIVMLPTWKTFPLLTAILCTFIPKGTHLALFPIIMAQRQGPLVPYRTGEDRLVIVFLVLQIAQPLVDMATLP